MNDRERLRRIDRVRSARTGEAQTGSVGEAFEMLTGLKRESAMFLLDYMLGEAKRRTRLSSELQLHVQAGMSPEALATCWAILTGIEIGIAVEAVRRGDGA